MHSIDQNCNKTPPNSFLNGVSETFVLAYVILHQDKQLNIFEKIKKTECNKKMNKLSKFVILKKNLGNSIQRILFTK